MPGQKDMIRGDWQRKPMPTGSDGIKLLSEALPESRSLAQLFLLLWGIALGDLR